jgi:hypothetical protein
MMTAGREPGDDDYDQWLEDELAERRDDAAWDDYIEHIFEERLKEYLRERGEKTGARHRAIKLERAARCQAAADAVWAKNPRLTAKAVANILEKQDREKHGSANVIRSLIKKPSAK